MAKEDAEKTTFTTPCGIYCYTGMTFGLKNAGATFQRLMCIALGEQMGRNAESYHDDIVVKTRNGDTLIEDLRETFTNLRKANPDKIRAIEEMKPPRKLKDIQHLTGCLAALGYGAFGALKRYLASPLVMVALRTREPTVVPGGRPVHSQCSPGARTGRAIPQEEDIQGDRAKAAQPDGLDGPSGKSSLVEALEPSPEETSASRFVQHPVYIVSTVLRDARKRYTQQ
ncbi:hypothetical protein QYE76_039182 [Lolium multiflorum]|uniref:Reverse transcriptase domain-containing protein n=1 Tax=Lolium multiflorum TaxID=4521 RepID=A0AAD8WRY3_LOLMU|nr:hypothetical protein QYE76_039182 [Lolium multiflorum]